MCIKYYYLAIMFTSHIYGFIVLLVDPADYWTYWYFNMEMF